MTSAQRIQSTTVEVRVGSQPSESPLSVSRIADSVLETAFAFCSSKMGHADTADIKSRLRSKDPVAYTYWQYGLAKGLAEQLGRLDEGVCAAFIYGCEATPEDEAFVEPAGIPLVHLIVSVQRKTAALDSLGAALDRSIGQAYRTLFGESHRTHALDLQFVDGDDIKSQVGYGALLASLRNRPIQIWAR